VWSWLGVSKTNATSGIGQMSAWWSARITAANPGRA
jgi:hypothetical protein